MGVRSFWKRRVPYKPLRRGYKLNIGRTRNSLFVNTKKGMITN